LPKLIAARSCTYSQYPLVHFTVTTTLTNSRHTSTTTPHPVPPPRSSQQLPSRRNIFDNDAFDNLAVDTSRLHIGRRGADQNADKILSDRSKAPAKSAILAALAVFDADDDEHDDTYDAEDVGAPVDTEDADLRDKNEETLFRAYQTAPELFGRESEIRRSKPRMVLKSETGMTDEAIEGWAIMMGRNPRQLRRLEGRFATFAGQQRELLQLGMMMVRREVVMHRVVGEEEAGEDEAADVVVGEAERV
jgi:activating signal cointegrator complex subunit 2